MVWHIAQRAIRRRVTADSSSETMQAKCIKRKKHNCLPTALYPGKIPFKNDNNYIIPDEQKRIHCQHSKNFQGSFLKLSSKYNWLFKVKMITVYLRFIV